MIPAARTGPLGAIGISNNTNPQWWRDNGLRKLVFFQVCILISQMTVGYDESVVGSLQAMRPWVEGQTAYLTTP